MRKLLALPVVVSHIKTSAPEKKVTEISFLTPSYEKPPVPTSFNLKKVLSFRPFIKAPPFPNKTNKRHITEKFSTLCPALNRSRHFSTPLFNNSNEKKKKIEKRKKRIQPLQR